MSSEDHTVSFSLEVDVTTAKDNLAELNRLVTTYLALARRVGLPENIMDALRRIQQLRVAAETTYRAITMLYAASGPIGGFIAIAGLTTGALMLADQVEIERSMREG